MKPPDISPHQVLKNMVLSMYLKKKKKKVKNLSTKSSNSLTSRIIDRNLAMVKAKDILFLDL